MKIILILPVLTFLTAAGLIFILGRQISKNQAELNRQKSEETGYFKNGRSANWLVATSPQKDRQGHVRAVMEMFVDLTGKKVSH